MALTEIRDESTTVDAELPGAQVLVGSLPPVQRRRRSLATLLPPLAVMVVFVGLWYLGSYVLLEESQRFLLPPPHQVVDIGFLRWENLSEIFGGLWATAQVALLGLFISIVLGTGFAIVMAQARWAERAFYPYAVVLQTIPILALVPLIGFWFDFTFRSRVLVAVIISLFPIITNTLFGLKSADRTLHDLFTLHGADRMTRLRKLSLPAALPAVFTGFRISAGLAVIGALVGDFFFRKGEPGIGRLLDIYRNNLDSELLFTALFFSSLLGLVMFWTFGWISNRVLRTWHESAGPGA